MSLHNFNPNNKSWKMYSNTITSISGDNLTIKPYDGKNLLLEVSGNNNIFFKKGDISYGLEDLIDTNITLTSVSGDIIPSNDNAFKLGDVSKNWSNAYIRDLSVSNISVSENFILNISGSMTNIIDIFNNLGDTFNTIGTLSNKEGFYGTINLINNTTNSSEIYSFILKDNKTSPTTIETGIFTNQLTTIPIVVAENSASRLLRPYYEYNVEYLYQDICGNNTTLQEANIGFTISGGTYRSANNKYYFTPNNNNINNGLLIVTSTLIKTGFYGTLTITNETTAGSIQKNIQAKLAFNNVDLTNYITISGDAQAPLTISQANRLLVPNSILQLKIIFAEGVEDASPANESGFTISGGTQNPLQQENTIDLLVGAGQIIDGSLNLTILVTAPSPPPANTGWYGTILFTFNTNAALDFVLNIDGYASNVSINTSTNTWTLPIGSRLATTSTLLPPIQIYPVYSYMITNLGFINGNITFANSPPYGFLIPTNLYNTTIEFNIVTEKD